MRGPMPPRHRSPDLGSPRPKTRSALSPPTLLELDKGGIVTTGKLRVEKEGAAPHTSWLHFHCTEAGVVSDAGKDEKAVTSTSNTPAYLAAHINMRHHRTTLLVNLVIIISDRNDYL
ncbi:hypothetical protein Pcinc_030529 [Petrolisthes cinctipes]|uniref:Uncharacterized protein n=1 Tax=Petrolisthes cinctipes TaxID=88211 RepID=A0AAE1EXY8_PETCI|nr:hypothetical protein Pcinc_030529 [Petrolisthes cinctipes]